MTKFCFGIPKQWLGNIYLFIDHLTKHKQFLGNTDSGNVDIKIKINTHILIEKETKNKAIIIKLWVHHEWLGCGRGDLAAAKGDPVRNLRQSFSEKHGSNISSRIRGKEWSAFRGWEKPVERKSLVEFWAASGEIPASVWREIRVWVVRSLGAGSSRRKLGLGKSAWRNLGFTLKKMAG